MKYFIEKISAAAGQIACKCAFFAVLLGAGLLGFHEVLASAVSLPDYPVILLIIAGTALLLLYDYVLTLLINWYYRRIRRVGGADLKLS